MKIFTTRNLSIILITTLTGCSSFYYPSEDRRDNNSFSILCNVPDAQVTSKGRLDGRLNPTSLQKTSDSRYVSFNSLERLSRTSRTILVSKENYDTFQLVVARTPRMKAILLNYFAAYFLLPIDVFRSDFYKIPKKSKEIEVDLVFTQKYLNDLYLEIIKKNEPNSIDAFINTYSYYKRLPEAIDFRDSLQLNLAILKYDENEMDKFIATHPKSNFLNEATKLKNGYEEARLKFVDVKQKKSIVEYEEYLQKYPTSLQRKEAVNDLLNLTFQKVLSSKVLDDLLTYNSDYMLKYQSGINPDTFISKSAVITKKVDNLIINENVTKSNDKYLSYSKLWKAHVQIINAHPNLINMERCLTYVSKISDMILFKLSQIPQESVQKKYLTQCENDFPSIQKNSNGYVDSSISFVLAIIENSLEFSGTIKLFNAKFYENWFWHSSERHPMKNLSGFTYLGKDFYNYTKATIEKITLSKGEIVEIILSEDLTPLVQGLSNNNNYEFSYFLDGEKVRTDFYKDGESYYYEFKNGINISLKEIEDAIHMADVGFFLEYQMTNESKLNQCRQGLIDYEAVRRNKFPKTHPINLKIEEKIQSAKRAISYVEEKIKQEEQRRQELARIEEQKQQELTRMQGIIDYYRKKGNLDRPPREFGRPMGGNDVNNVDRAELEKLKRNWEKQHPNESFFISQEPVQITRNQNITSVYFTNEDVVLNYLRGKTFYNTEKGITVSYGNIPMYNTEGMKVFFKNGGRSYYINPHIDCRGKYAVIRAMGTEGDGNDSEFTVYSDGRFVIDGFTFYLK
jgi:hypothetical protein